MKATKNGFSKMKLLVILGVFVLVVAIAIPVGFGFNKDEFPDVNVGNNETAETYPEYELNIIDQVLPSKDKTFETSVEKGNEEVSSTEKTPSKPTTTNPQKPITGTVDILDVNTKVENQGKTEVENNDEKVYTEVEATVVPEITIPSAPSVPNTPSVEEKEELLPIPSTCSDALRQKIEDARSEGFGQIKLDADGNVKSYQTGPNTWVEFISAVPEDQISSELEDLFN